MIHNIGIIYSHPSKIFYENSISTRLICPTYTAVLYMPITLLYVINNINN